MTAVFKFFFSLGDRENDEVNQLIQEIQEEEWLLDVEKDWDIFESMGHSGHPSHGT